MSFALALCGLCDVGGVCMGVWVVCGCITCVLCVCYVGVGVSALYMHYVSVSALMAGFGCEGYCGGFEDGKNMATKYACTAG